MKAIKIKHSNRNHHNWLIYKITERVLLKNTNLYNGTVYDLGCGEKPYESFFRKFVQHYIGVDWSNTPHKLNADIVADLNKTLPIDSGVAEVIISISVLEHLCEPQIMLNEAFRILKPGGTILLQVPWQWWIHEAPYDYYRYSPFGLKYLFEKSGFTKVDVQPTGGYFSTAILKFNYFTLRLINLPKPIRAVLKGLLIPVWYVGQTIAPILDKIDRNWILEAPGYWVIAKKV